MCRIMILYCFILNIIPLTQIISNIVIAPKCAIFVKYDINSEPTVPVDGHKAECAENICYCPEYGLHRDLAGPKYCRKFHPYNRSRKLRECQGSVTEYAPPRGPTKYLNHPNNYRTSLDTVVDGISSHGRHFNITHHVRTNRGYNRSMPVWMAKETIFWLDEDGQLNAHCPAGKHNY